MEQAGFFETRTFSPTSMTLIVGLHAIAIIAALAAKMELPPRWQATDTDVFEVEAVKEKAEPPKPQGPVQ